MLNWQNASQEDLDLLLEIEVLLSNNIQLLTFIFHSKEPRLRAPATVILFESGVFSSGQQILIQLALDIWDGSGHTQVMDLVHLLDSQNYSRAMKVLNNHR